jgi:hypothetical protein
MTAEVAVMNTQGVAIAADSAVTISVGDNNKTYYTQQKIFNLSCKHSVGIMIYGASEFMNINWEIIINEFSKDLGDRILPTLREYAEYLLVFLRDFVHITDNNQKDYLEIMSCSFFREIKGHYDADIAENIKDQEIARAQQSKILSGVLKKTRELLENEKYSSGFDDDGFVKNNKAIIIKEMEEVFSDFSLNEKIQEEMIELFLLDIEKLEIAFWERINSGVVFAGYGDKEIYPSAIDFRLFGRLGKNLVHTSLGINDVMNDSNAWIIPYAQTEVINTFIKGIAPDFKYIIAGELEGLIEGIITVTGEKNAEEICKLKDEFKKKIEDYEEENYKNPVMRIVASLPKSNLVEMAEALINLTALRQHVSAEEQTVGGPTDVALITKTDGFVWIKKKQVFNSL